MRRPTLWLFTDAARVPDPLPAIAALPPGLCGVVFRHDGVEGRAVLARAVAACCRQRRVALSVAGDWRLAALLGAGVHRRAGCAEPPRGRFRTASAHSRAELLQARRAGALVFLSPVFPTASHPGASTLGPVRWAALAGQPGAALALGGIDASSARRLPRCRIAGAGAITALCAPAPRGESVWSFFSRRDCLPSQLGATGITR